MHKRLDHEDMQREQQNNKHGHTRWTVDKIKTKQNKMPYYTGFHDDQFKMILNFLAPTPEVPFVATKKLNKVVYTLPLEQQFDFDFAHLATI